MKKKGTSMVPVDSAGAGDIISMAGLTSPSIGHTVANVEVTELFYLLPQSNNFHQERSQGKGPFHPLPPSFFIKKLSPNICN